VAVADPADASGWIAKTLFEVNLFYWGAGFADGGGTWPSLPVHAS
jgi:hypothetical protein